MMTCAKLCAGALRHRVALQRAITTPDGMGGQTVVWQQYASMRAFMEIKSGMERTAHDRLEAVQRIHAYMRYRDDVLERDRILFEGRAYQIRAVKDLEFRRQWLELDLEAGVAT
jgi:SPP1 family predicted phage head-tail adaptor